MGDTYHVPLPKEDTAEDSFNDPSVLPGFPQLPLPAAEELMAAISGISLPSATEENLSSPAEPEIIPDGSVSLAGDVEELRAQLADQDTALKALRALVTSHTETLTDMKNSMNSMATSTAELIREIKRVRTVDQSIARIEKLEKAEKEAARELAEGAADIAGTGVSSLEEILKKTEGTAATIANKTTKPGGKVVLKKKGV